jgi:CBS domain-containing protein
MSNFDDIDSQTTLSVKGKKVRNARDIMSHNVVTVLKDASIKELAELFVKHGVNGIPVVDIHSQLIGIVTESDLIDRNKNLHIPTVIALFDAVIYLESNKKFEDDVRKMTATKVVDIYNPNVITVAPSTPVDECANLMAEKKVHTLPVVEGGKLLGVIGKLDIIKALSNT